MNKFKIFASTILMLISFGASSQFNNSGLNEKYTLFITQYSALKQEGIQLWGAAQEVDVSDRRKVLDIRKEILNFRRKETHFSDSVSQYYMNYDEKQFSNNRPSEGLEEYSAITNSMGALSNLLDMASQYIDLKQTAYLKVAIKYEESWLILDRLVLK